MKDIVKWGLVILLIVFLLYYLGIIEEIPVISDTPYVENLKLSDQCIRKSMTGNYEMSLLFEESDNKNYSDGKLEIFYFLGITKNGCEINGNGYKSKDISQDSLGVEVIRNYNENQFPVILAGEINGETIEIELAYETSSNKDCRVITQMISKNSKIKIARGIFEEACNNSSGTVKIFKID